MARVLRRIGEEGSFYGLLTLLVIFAAFPFYWMLITTFKTEGDLYNLKSIPYWFVTTPTFEHLRYLIHYPYGCIEQTTSSTRPLLYVANIVEQIDPQLAQMKIEDAKGHDVAVVKKAMITPLRERFSVEVEDGPDLDVTGNIVDHEYVIDDGRQTVATVSKKWFRIADTYGIEVAPGQDAVLILAVAAAVDAMSHD